MCRSWQAIFGWPPVKEAGPDPLSKTTSLRQLIADKHNVHIVYVHGIKAEGPGASQALIAFLTKQLRFTEPTSFQDSLLNLGKSPDATIFGQPLYRENDWASAQTFVRHHRLVREGGDRVIISEVNYWPMLFPLKTRMLLVPEHDLSGTDKRHLEIVKKNTPPFHDWIGPPEQQELRKPARGGRAAWINRFAKQDLLNWGLSDAVVALGSMRLYLNYAMQLAFDAAFGSGDPSTFDYVVMAESLGSFIVLDAMDTQPAVQAVMERTDHLYFFANQVMLLELARIQGLPPSVPREDNDEARSLIKMTAAPSPRPSAYEMLARWSGAERSLVDRPKQIIAFSDPSDTLTYRVPPIPGVHVVNLYDRNTPRWLGIDAEPGRAHLGHIENKAVWNVLEGAVSLTGNAPSMM